MSTIKLRKLQHFLASFFETNIISQETEAFYGIPEEESNMEYFQVYQVYLLLLAYIPHIIMQCNILIGS